jgi:hypothetical protein
VCASGTREDLSPGREGFVKNLAKCALNLQVRVMTLAELRPSLRGALHWRLDRAIWPQSTCVGELGRLRIGAWQDQAGTAS